MFFSCDILSTYDEEKIKEMFADYNIVTFVRLILSDLPSEKLYEQMQMKEFPVKGECIEGRILADSWTKAFVAKDVETIMKLATEETRQKLSEYEILDEEVPMFGWSSPWPALFTEEGYQIISCDNYGAEIIYYASYSMPQVIVWKETLKFENGQVSSWELQRYEEISTLNDYINAYSKNSFKNTPMDYYSNGLGETLNNNALLYSSTEYEMLFDAGSAALEFYSSFIYMPKEALIFRMLSLTEMIS